MKTALALIAVLALTTANAQQRIETFTKRSSSSVNPFPVLPTDLVEVLSQGIYGAGERVKAIWSDGIDSDLGGSIKGITGINFKRPDLDDEISWVTVRITPAGTTPLVSPPVVVPVTEGKATLSIEASTDLQTWFPAGEGDIPADSPARFFRLKVLVTP